MTTVAATTAIGARVRLTQQARRTLFEEVEVLLLGLCLPARSVITQRGGEHLLQRGQGLVHSWFALLAVAQQCQGVVAGVIVTLLPVTGQDCLCQPRFHLG
jgi:hypothetical protein